MKLFLLLVFALFSLNFIRREPLFNQILTHYLKFYRIPQAWYYIGVSHNRKCWRMMSEWRQWSDHSGTCKHHHTDERRRATQPGSNSVEVWNKQQNHNRNCFNASHDKHARQY